MDAVIVRSGKKIRQLRTVAREALQAVKELERAMSFEVFGRYVVSEEEEEIDMDDVARFLHFARLNHPQQELEIFVIAHSPDRGREENNGGGRTHLQRV